MHYLFCLLFPYLVILWFQDDLVFYKPSICTVYCLCPVVSTHAVQYHTAEMVQSVVIADAFWINSAEFFYEITAVPEVGYNLVYKIRSVEGLCDYFFVDPCVFAETSVGEMFTTATYGFVLLVYCYFMNVVYF